MKMGNSMSAQSSSVNYFSGFAKVSFDGFINENKFELNPKEKNLVENLEIYHGVAKNPLNYKKDIFLGFLVKSKYDGIGGRKPIDLSIALDVSGSMSSIDDSKIGKSRLTLAKEGLKKLISILDERNDRVSLLTFNHEIQKLFTLNFKKDIETKFLNDIDAIKANGGTDLFASIEAAIENFSKETNDNKLRRILCITDAYYSDYNNELYNLIKNCVEEKNISITFMAIGSDSNLSLADKLCDFKGCNYFTIAKTEELENYLTVNFKNIFFPVAHNTKIRVSCENYDVKINKCIGGSEPDIKTNANKESYFNIGSYFPSEIITLKENEEDKAYVEGNIVLLKIETNSNNNLKFEFNLEYETFDGKKSSQNYEYEIQSDKLNVNYFSNRNIQKGISIYYFTEVLNVFVEKYNKLNNYNSNLKDNEEEKKKEIEFIENAQSVRDYLKKNFVFNKNDEESEKNFKKYLELITERYQKYNENFCNFYKIVPMLVLW
jgi:hypothetical protein